MSLRNKVTFVWMIAFLAVGLASAACAADSREVFMLIDGRKSDAEIVIEKNPLAMVRYAATEFQDYVKKITGAELRIVEVGTDYKTPVDGKHRVFIGESAYTRSLGLAPARLKSDGYYVRITPITLILVGRDEPVPYIENKQQSGRYEMGFNENLKLCGTGQTGSLYAVYHFLEKYCDARWYWPGELGEVIPKSKRIVAPVADYSVEPSFELRMYYAFDFAKDPEAARWYRRAGFGATSDPMWPNVSFR